MNALTDTYQDQISDAEWYGVDLRNPQFGSDPFAHDGATVCLLAQGLTPGMRSEAPMMHIVLSQVCEWDFSVCTAAYVAARVSPGYRTVHLGVSHGDVDLAPSSNLEARLSVIWVQEIEPDPAIEEPVEIVLATLDPIDTPEGAAGLLTRVSRRTRLPGLIASAVD